jgi:hypothetical protein
MPRNSFNSVIQKNSVREPESMLMADSVEFESASNSKKTSTQPKSESLVLQTVRQYFPETWLWNIYVSK